MKPKDLYYILGKKVRGHGVGAHLSLDMCGPCLHSLDEK